MDENQVTENVEPLETEQEKLLSQSQVNKIVQREKEQAASRARREADDQHQREIESLRANQVQKDSQVSKQPDVDAMYQQMQERFNREMQEQQQTQHMNQVAQSYLAKMAQGRETYGEEFDEAMKDFDPTAFPQLVYLVANMDGASDIMYDLAKNPMKLAALDRLAEKNPRHAQSELTKLAASIVQNKQAQQEAGNQGTSAPLDRLNPSRVSGSNGKLTISELRNQPWLRV